MQVIAVAKTFWGWATATKIIGSITVANVIGAVGLVGASTVIGRSLAPKLSLGQLNTASPLQLQKGSTEYHRVVYGETRVGGVLFDALETGTDREYLHMLIVHAAHECADLSTCWLNDEIITLDGSGNATGTYAGHLRIRNHLGEPDQVADSLFVAESGGSRSETDVATGLCYTYARLKYNREKFATGATAITRLVKGRKVWDPRDEEQDPDDPSTWGWNDNPPLCILDYMLAEFGVGEDRANINLASFIAAANACDELVDGKKRYTLNGTFELNAEPGTILEKMVESMAGTLVNVGGEWVLHAGVWRTPVHTLDETDLRDGAQIQPQASMREAFNVVRGTFTSPEIGYQSDEFTAVLNEAEIEEDDGRENGEDLDLSLVTDHAQARRIAQIKLEQIAQGMFIEYPCKLTALRVRAGDNILLNNEENGFVNKPFFVEKLTFVPYSLEGEPTLGVNLILRETSATIYNDLEDEGYDPEPNTNLPNPKSVPAPTGLTLLSNNTTGIEERDGHYTPRILATWDPAGSILVLEGGYGELEYRENGDTDWIPVNARVAGDATSHYITGVTSGKSWDVRLRWINIAGVPSLWTTVLDYDVPADQTPPGVPTGFSMEAVPDGIRFLCTAPGDLDVTTIEYFYNTTGTEPVDATAALFTDGCKPGDPVESPRGGLTAGVLHYGWARAKDGSGNTSDWTSVQTATPQAASGYVDGLISDVMADVAALIDEANQLAADLIAEVAAREEAIINEASARETADEAITTSLTAFQSEYDSNKAIVAGQISAITTVNTAQATDITALYASVGTNAANISSVSSALATLDSATASSIASVNATIAGVDATVDTIAAAYLNGGVATATWGFKLDGGGKVVAMQAIAASGGSTPETGVIVFSGADLRSDNYSTGSSGWIIRADGSVEFADGTFRGDLRLNSSTSTPGYSGNTETGFAVEAANGAMFASRSDNFAGSFNRNDNGDLILMHRNGSQVGTIAVTSVSTSYNTSSDSRIKLNVVDAPDVGDLFDATRVVEHEFYMDPGVKYLGFIAQELNMSYPQAVRPGDDYNHPFLGGRPWAVDHSKLVPPLWKEVQSHRDRLSEIEERLAALEAA